MPEPREHRFECTGNCEAPDNCSHCRTGVFSESKLPDGANECGAPADQPCAYGGLHQQCDLHRQPTLPVRIEVGRRYVWEPTDPKYREVVKVRSIIVNEDGEAWVETVAERPGVGPRWNEADRFQEACIYG